MRILNSMLYKYTFFQIVIKDELNRSLYNAHSIRQKSHINDKQFKRQFQLWLNELWQTKDAQLDALKRSDAAGQ